MKYYISLRMFSLERAFTSLYSHESCRPVASQMSKAFLDEYGLLPPLLEIMHINQAVEVLRVCLACIINILSEDYRIHKLVECGLISVVRPLSGHEDGQVQQYVAAVLLAISSCSGLEEWLVSCFESTGSQKSLTAYRVELLTRYASTIFIGTRRRNRGVERACEKLGCPHRSTRRWWPGQHRDNFDSCSGRFHAASGGPNYNGAPT